MQIGCLLHASVRGNLVTTRWQFHRLSSPGFVRPRQGEATVKVECPRCQRVLAMSVESLRRAETKRRVQVIAGALLLASLLVWVPLLVRVGGRTADEADPAVLSVGVLFALTAVSFVLGLALFLNGRTHGGFGKVRLVRADGTLSRRLQGHRLQS